MTIGEVGGLVENFNLRITQLWDGDGRLITIPNGLVATKDLKKTNYSSSQSYDAIQKQQLIEKYRY